MEAGARGGLDKVREKRFLRLLFSFSVLFSCFFIFSELLVAAQVEGVVREVWRSGLPAS